MENRNQPGQEKENKTGSELYNEAYYHNHCGSIPYEESEQWTGFFGKVADQIVAELKPKTVLDAGCAMGYLVAALRDRGVEAYGVDISEYAISKVREDIRPYCAVGSLTEPLPDCLPKHFDLVTNVEVLEHLSEEDGRKAIANLTSLADTILFSSTPDDYEEPTHVNVQQREYWACMFAEKDFYDDLSLRPVWLTYQAILFRRGINLIQSIENYERFIRSSEKEIELTAALKRNEELQNDVDILNTRLNVVQQELSDARNTLSWKITKPFRWLVIIVEWIFLPGKEKGLFRKGLRSLKTNGLRVTVKKALDRMRLDVKSAKENKKADA